MSPEPTQTPPLTAHRLFFGDDGLRAGWSLLLFILLAALLVFGLSALARQTHLLVAPAPHSHAPATSAFVAVGESIGCIAFLLAALLMSRIEQRPFARYGLTSRRLLPDLLTGLSFGLLFLSGLVALLYVTHHLAFDAVLLHGSQIPVNGLEWLWAFFLVGLQEEFVTRGYIQYTVSRGIAGLTRALDPTFGPSHALSFWITALIFSVGFFTAGHLVNPGETAAGIAAVGLAGITFAFSLWRTGSLWWAIGFHTAWDWAQSFLFGVPDSGTIVANRLLATHPLGPSFLSGGSAGPEGSVFVLPTFLLVCLVIHLTLPRRSYPLTSDQSSPAAPAP